MDPTSTLEYIKTQISNIYTAAKTSSINDEQALYIDHVRYSKLYTAVHNYCTSSHKSKSSGYSSLYRSLVTEVQNYCIYIRDMIFSVSTEGMDGSIAARKVLVTYMACYRRFVKVAALVRGIVRVWDRHWVRQQWDNKEIQVRSVEGLHKMIWKEEVLEKKGLEEVTDAVAVLEKSDGDMSEYDLALVKDVVKSLFGLDVTLEC